MAGNTKKPNQKLQAWIDPAAVRGDQEDRLAAFRHVRDELRRRVTGLFGD